MTAGEEDAELERLTAAVREGRGYRTLCEPIVRRIGEMELRKRRPWKETVKETRSRLHQIAGAYLESPPPYAKWLETLRTADTAEARQGALVTMMRRHASTAERLPELDGFYRAVFATLPPIRSVADIACGLNPLTIPWMGLAPGARYFAYDLYTDMMDFLQEAALLEPLLDHVALTAAASDVAGNPPGEEVDAALIMKFLPVLQQVDRGGAAAWLRGLRARFLIVTYPTRTLGGRNVGMAGFYAAQFLELIAPFGWSCARYEFDGELCFVVETRKE